jgi:lantibiotic transport system ATP-binding protein
MTGPVIEIKDLSFRYGKQLILDKISLSVPQGSIYGFLGPNGSGKTTTIKVLMNLLQVPHGHVFLFGEEISRKRTQVLSKVGALIEQPAIYSHLSGRENLRNRAMLLKIDAKRVDFILDLIGLTAHAGKKAGQYSLGMKQRLGIGLALLPDPDLLVLDEPTNGLDPNGIIEIRNLLIRLSREQGKTVFISSHLLSEIEKTASHVGIINSGKLLFQGSISDLHQQSAPLVELVADDIINAANHLLTRGYKADIIDNRIQVPYTTQEEMGHINTTLVSSGHTVYSIKQTQKDLEQLFLNLLQN